MRADMDKVIVERPRHPGSGRKAKGYWKRLRQGWHEGLPRREGIKRRWRNGTKAFNEHLGPLRRFLTSNVGRPWDKVFSEIRARISPKSVVQAHVLTHVFQYVEVQATLIDGVPHNCRGPLYFQRFYVCPRTGLLRKVKHSPRRKWMPTEPLHRFKLDDLHQYCWIKGAWHVVTLKELPAEVVQHLSQNYFSSFKDVALGRTVSLPDLLVLYGAPVVAIASRRLSKRDLRQLLIPL